MINHISLKTILSSGQETESQYLAIFALLNLGVLESLANGTLSAINALKIFFHAENCLFVKKVLRNANADKIMSHGVQLADLFEVLPPLEAQREFLRELSTIRVLCLSLLEQKQLAA